MVRNFIAALLFSVLGPLLTPPPPPPHPLLAFLSRQSPYYSDPPPPPPPPPPPTPVEFSAKLVFFPVRTVLVAD